MRFTLTSAVVGLALVSLPSVVSAQDFNCKTAKSKAEKTICGSGRLRELDEQMGVQYGYARAHKLSRKQEKRVIREQRAWLKTRNSCGGDVYCLEDMYVKRIAVLEEEAETRQGASAGKCNVAGYSIDKDRRGLNVRSGPSTKNKVIARLKRVNDGGYYILPEFDIVGSKGKWLKIARATQGLDGKVLFKGSGWVHSSRVATMTRGYDKGHVTLRVDNRKSSDVLTRVPRETEVGIRGCDGAWALVVYKGKRGWLAPSGQCGTAATTCN